MPDRDRLTGLFIRFAECSSESLKEKDFCRMVEDKLLSLGLRVERDEAGGRFGSDGFNIYARLAGEGEPILLNAHLDTVAPCCEVKPVNDNGVIRSGGDTILGADDKAAVAAIIEAVESVLESGLPHRTVEILFTLSEEIGMLGAKYADYSKVISKKAIVLDGDTTGEIVNSNPANVVLRFTVTGKAAHAGIAPEEGIHALKAAAEAVAAIPVGHVDDLSVMNVGTFTCPGKTNIVPPLACFEMEVRSFSEQRLRELIALSEDAVKNACAQYGACYEMETSRHSTVVGTPEDSSLIDEIKAALAAIGEKATVTSSFGGCDMTHIGAQGIEVANLGIGMKNIHSCEENIGVEDLFKAAQMLEHIIVSV